MDVEKLIVFVQERPPLWNQKLSQYHLRNVQIKLWDEIGEEMKTPVAEIKKKWKGLGDTFQKELKKCLAEKFGEAADSSEQWPYFTLMEFLSDTMVPKDTQTSIPTAPEELDEFSQSEGSQNEFGGSIEVGDGIIPTTPRPKEFKSPLKRNRKLQKQLELDEKFLEVERQKLSLFQKASDEAQDDDHQYLLNLLPFLRKIPSEQKLQARMEMMNVHVKYTTPQSSNCFNTFSYPSVSSPGTSTSHMSDASSSVQQYLEHFTRT